MTQPLYKEIASEIRGRIHSGLLKHNDKIPAQTELANQFGVSVLTVQKALAILVEEGLIYRLRKRGSFVQSAELPSLFKPMDSAIKKIYFVYNEVPIHTFSRDLHVASLTGLKEVCRERGLSFHMDDLRNRWELPGGPDSGYVLWGFSGHNAVGYPRLEFLNAVERWKASGVPLVIMHHYFAHLPVPRVNCDNVQGAFLITKHLLSLGHRRIGIILSGESEIELNPEFVLRLQGYRMALQSENIPFDASLLYVKNGPSGEDEESGYNGFRRLMELANPPTAVFAGSDSKALGALHAARDHGLRVPEDISIVGYDGSLFGANTIPPLTSVDQDFHLLGRQAAEAVLQTVTGHVQEILVPPKLTIRESTMIRAAVAMVE